MKTFTDNDTGEQYRIEWGEYGTPKVYTIKPIETKDEKQQEYVVDMAGEDGHSPLNGTGRYITCTKPQAQAIADAVKEVLNIITVKEEVEPDLYQFPPTYLINLITAARKALQGHTDGILSHQKVQEALQEQGKE